MNREEAAAYVFAQAVCALAEIQGMKALNDYRKILGHQIAYDDGPFVEVIEKYGIHHNAVINLYQAAEG